MAESHQKSMGAWIPTFILDDPDLTPTEKLLYAIIVNLCNDRGYCWASNEYLAKRVAVSSSCVSRTITRLRDKNILIDFYEVNDQGRFRRLKIDHPLTGPAREEEGVGVGELPRGGRRIAQGGIGNSPTIGKKNTGKKNSVGETPTTPSGKSEKKSLEDRSKDFYKSLVPFKDKFGGAMLRSFFEYWSEVNDAKTKMKWEIRRTRDGTFDLEKRLATWHAKEEPRKKGEPEVKTTASAPKSYHR